MSKRAKMLSICAAVFVVMAVSATLVLSVLTMLKVNSMGGRQLSTVSVIRSEQQSEGSKENTQPFEDGVVIAESYTIQSTKQISDAYLSADNTALTDVEKETLTLASAVLNSVVKDKMTPYEKECAVFQWMHSNIQRDEGVLTLIQDDPDAVSMPLGVLKNKKAVCAGYATTFRLFMQMLQIPCHVVPASGLGHAWNLVQLGNSWYHVDIYSAAEDNNGRFYLNLPDAMMTQDWDKTAFPSAVSYEFCWSYQNAEQSTDIYTIPEKIKKAVDAREKNLSMLFTSEASGSKSTAEALLLRVSQKLMYSEEYGNLISQCTSGTAEVDGKLFVCVTLHYYDVTDDDVSGSLDDDRIDSAITDAFGELHMENDSTEDDVPATDVQVPTETQVTTYPPANVYLPISPGEQTEFSVQPEQDDMNDTGEMN